MTYSIVAMDREEGVMGVAVQSHYFSVGTVVPWVEPGTGVVATQALVEPSYGPRGLAAMCAGLHAYHALEGLLAADTSPAVRQVSFLDVEGNVHTHTGKECIPEAGHRIGHLYSCQANMMERDTVWDAMAEAYEDAEGTLKWRLLAALEAAEEEGGDIRGKQSAAIIIAHLEPSSKPWHDVPIDLRVEDSPDPIGELGRLLEVKRAYHYAEHGDLEIEMGNVSEARDAFEQARRIAPENDEFAFWEAIMLAKAGEEAQAITIFDDLFSREPQWRELLRRLPRAKLIDEAIVTRLLK
ncbi:MAG TPA: DUF1028 domain-containing protein [Methanomicrobia archaeon]|nr:DUF1028 domain-containing protein [Methanomicrobia archaeon]